MANPDSPPATGNDFPDAPDHSDEGARGDQDQPDLDVFAAKLGLAQEPGAGTKTSGTVAARVNKASEVARSRSTKMLSVVASGFGNAADRLRDVVDKVTDGEDDREITLADLIERVDSVRTVMVTTTDERGTLSSRPLTVQRIEDGGDIAFIVDSTADWVTSSMEPVNVALVDSGRTWISVAGRMAVDNDQALLDDLWNPATDAFFPGGRSGATVLRVQADRWEYWTSPNKLRQLVNITHAKLADEAADLGESGSVET